MKQIISSILALSLCISVPAPIFAADQTNEHNTFFTKQYLSENTTLQQVKSLQTHRSSNVQYNIDVEILHDITPIVQHIRTSTATVTSNLKLVP